MFRNIRARWPVGRIRIRSSLAEELACIFTSDIPSITRLLHISILIFCSLFFTYPLVSQYHWTTPVKIDDVYGNTVGSLAADDSNNVYAAVGGASVMHIYRSTDHGDTWNLNIYDGQEAAQAPSDIAVDHAGNVWLAWISSPSGPAPTYVNLSKSTDGGQTFNRLFRSLSYSDGFFSQKLAIDDDNSIYMIWDDSLLTVTRFRHGDINQRYDARIPVGTHRIGFTSCLAVSNNHTIHCLWNGEQSDYQTGYHSHIFYSQSIDTGITFQEGIRVDTVGDTRWNYAQLDPSLAIDDSSQAIYICYSRVPKPQDGIIFLKSVDSGKTFSYPIVLSNDSNNHYPHICIDSQSGLNVVWGGPNSGLLHRRSIDQGVTFSKADTINQFGIRDLIADHTGLVHVLLVQIAYLFTSHFNSFLSVQNDIELPNSTQLLPSYPNPFNSSATISFTVSRTAECEIQIYDVLGREVATLLQEKKEAGNYSAEWNGEGFPSGVYFYRLVATSVSDGRRFTDVRKMVLVR